MIYHILNSFVRPLLRCFFKTISFEGLDNIPKDKPVLYCANHPNSFLDGVILCALLDIPTYVLVRGDVFKNKYANFILRSIRLLPIFRSTDADRKTALQENNKTYDECFEMFKKNKKILIFSEAISLSEWKLRPLKKGSARIFLDMISREDGQLDLAIVPMGFSYSFYKGFRKDVLIKFQKPFYKKDLDKEQNVTKHISQITSMLTDKIEDAMVLEPEKEHFDVYQAVIDIVREELKTPLTKYIIKNNIKFSAEKKVSKLFIDHPNKINDTATQYFDNLKKHGLEEGGYYANSFINWLLFIVFIIPSSIAWLIFNWPFTIGRIMADKKVKKIQFYDSISMGFSVVSSLVWVIILFILSIVFYGWIGLLVFLGLRYIVVTFLWCKSILKRFSLHRQWARLNNKQPGVYQNIESLRNKLVEKVSQ